ncbi:MAG: hypothetical protein V8R75_09645 [Oscillospiraceae bacterium]
MMALLKWELRKIWRPGILVAILVLGAVYYWMFPQFYIEHFCNGPQAQAQFALASGWVERYGPTLEQRSGRSWMASWRKRSLPLTRRSPPSRRPPRQGSRTTRRFWLFGTTT